MDLLNQRPDADRQPLAVLNAVGLGQLLVVGGFAREVVVVDEPVLVPDHQLVDFAHGHRYYIYAPSRFVPEVVLLLCPLAVVAVYQVLYDYF